MLEYPKATDHYYDPVLFRVCLIWLDIIAFCFQGDNLDFLVHAPIDDRIEQEYETDHTVQNHQPVIEEVNGCFGVNHRQVFPDPINPHEPDNRRSNEAFRQFINRFVFIKFVSDQEVNARNKVKKLKYLILVDPVLLDGPDMKK